MLDKVSGTKLHSLFRIFAMTDILKLFGIRFFSCDISKTLHTYFVSNSALNPSISPRERHLHQSLQKISFSRDITPHFSSYSLLSSLPCPTNCQPSYHLNFTGPLPTFEHLLHSCHSQAPSVQQWLLFQHIVRVAASGNESRVPMDMFRTIGNCA